MKKSLGPKIIVGATPLWVIGTYDEAGRPNLMAAAWVGVCCGDPPCLSVSLRKATYTHRSITEQKVFTVNIPSVAHAREADYVGIASGRDTDKWQTTGLTPTAGDLVGAPCVAEFPIVIECRLLHTFELGLHTQFVGEIVDVKAEESILAVDGSLDIERTDPFFFVPGNGNYYAIGQKVGKAFSAGADFRNRRKQRD